MDNATPLWAVTFARSARHDIRGDYETWTVFAANADAAFDYVAEKLEAEGDMKGTIKTIGMVLRQELSF